MSRRASFRAFGLALSLVFVAALTAKAETLTVGDSAPALDVSKWVKGEKVESLEPGKTYVVEFWATWCGPCRTSIPHLTELQKKYKDDVTFIGVSVFEQDQGKVAPFVKDMGDKMDYRVALDDVPSGKPGNEGKMAASWMNAAEEPGIPTAFIVKDGKINWIGHPMSMGEPLSKVVAGTWNLQAAASQRKEDKAIAQKLTAFSLKFGPLVQQRKFKEAVAAIDEAIASTPKLEGRLGMTKYMMLMQAGEPEAAAKYGQKLIDGDLKDNAMALNTIAWAIVAPNTRIEAGQRDLKLALKAAERANDLSKGENPMILDTLARVYFDMGEVGKAIETQEKAVRLAGPKDEQKKKALEEYRKAAKDKSI